MTVKICTSENMLATVNGLGMARHWYPRIVAEAFLESTKDGEIQRAPDPVTMIDGDLTWFNNTRDPQAIIVQVLRAPRSVVVQSPNTVVIHDAWSFAKGTSPQADFPSVIQNTMGGRMQVDRPSAAAADLQYARLFFDTDSAQSWVDVGVIDPGDSLHFRYLAAVQTPGVWTTASEFEPRWEAQARWTRLLAFATPAAGV
ncbi:hypothetical protein H7K45_27665 [Mycobacterium yunnanensis]|uniref:DUF7172 domain-containing protein n=1 Tax=Mycobacterium yunnanensis TaxID=368477 RepID=A0A9X2Z726_9MYCO|nr:hypothetical protein [Mycobacterium yunnanensis]MCV7424330.1 hypothetical protein [Mycobacterium yunnanensis]